LHTNVLHTQQLQETDVLAKWEATSWAKKRASKVKRASLTDLDRFKLMVARKQKARAVNKALAKLKKSSASA
jgi:large subunit ribosomal protein L14e